MPTRSQDFVRQQLADLGLGELRVFGLSALEALDARDRSDDARLAASGLPALESALVGLPTTERAKTFLQNVAARAANLVNRQLRDLRLGLVVPDAGGDTTDAGPRAILTAFDSGCVTSRRRSTGSPTRSRTGSRPTYRVCSMPAAGPGRPTWRP